MIYTVAAIPTAYAGVRFRSRLEARWAAFFDLAGWKWQYEPVDLGDWTPDFWARIPCAHSECEGGHELHVEVKPYRFWPEPITTPGHPAIAPGSGLAHVRYLSVGAQQAFVGHPVAGRYEYDVPSPAMFGLGPEFTHWAMCHGHGGGDETVPTWVKDSAGLWATAGNTVQWRGR